MAGRAFAKLHAELWAGDTGRQIRRLPDPAPAWAVATYLIGCRHATMLGIYPLPLVYAAHDLGMDRGQVEGAIEALSRLGFCRYDWDEEVVWVVQAARYQVLQGEHRALAPADNLVASCRAQYRAVPPCALRAPFFDHYAELLHLDQRLAGTEQMELGGEAEGKALTKPLGRPLPSPLEGASQGPYQAREQRAESREHEDIRDSERIADTQKRPSDPAAVVYRPRRKGQRVVRLEWEAREDWEAFWDAFAYKQGKQDALGAWCQLAPSRALVRDVILPAARAEAKRRPEKEAAGQTPIMAQGWLTARRFEDEALQELARKWGLRPKTSEEQAAEAEAAARREEQEALSFARATVDMIQSHLRDGLGDRKIKADVVRRTDEAAPDYQARCNLILTRVLEGDLESARHDGLRMVKP